MKEETLIPETEQRHAYMILSHTNWEQLICLLRLLDDPHNDIYLHVDRNAADVPMDRLHQCVQKATLTILRRFRTEWGSYSIVRAELLLLEAATKRPHLYYHLLSGQDLPLKTQKEIRQILGAGQKQEYVSFTDEVYKTPELLFKRLGRYRFLQGVIGKGNSGFMKRLCIKLELTSCCLQDLLLINRIRGVEKEIYYGSQWFSITDGFARWMLAHRNCIKKRFRWTLIPDEHFVQTLLIQSPFRDRIAGDNLRFIDWDRGSPYTFRADDYEMLISGNFLFARKFDENTDATIISEIAEELNKRAMEK